MDQLLLQAPATMPRTFGYSHVATIPAGHELVWTAGQVGIGADGALAEGDWETQTRVAFANVGAALQAGGARWADVFKLTIYVVDTAQIATVRSVRDEFVDIARPPTSTLVQVAGLALPGLLIEVEAVAAVGAGG